jgi:hypothetical protein
LSKTGFFILANLPAAGNNAMSVIWDLCVPETDECFAP